MKRTNIDIIKALDGLNLSAKYKNVLFDILNSANGSNKDDDDDDDAELINEYAYGIRWDDTEPGSTCERIGNLDLHRTLPIQSKLSICTHKGQCITAYTELDDARFINESGKQSETLDKVKLIDGYQCISVESDNAEHLYSWVKINVDGYNYIGRVIPAEDLQGEANINKIWCPELVNHPNIIIEDSEKYLLNVNIEYGICVNGYDGELGVDTGDSWYLWSKEYGTIHEVWMSTVKCVPYAREIPRFIISRNKPIFLTESIKDRSDAEMWGWLGKLDSNLPVSIANYKSFARGIGNTNDDNLKHKYFTYNLFDFNKTNDSNINNSLSKTTGKNSPVADLLSLVKTVETVNIDNSYNDCKSLYSKLCWEALTWMYVVEYADFNPTKDFTEELTSEGFHQGGLGNATRSSEISADALLDCGIKSAYKQSGPYNLDTNVWTNASSYFKLNVTGSITNSSLIINKTLDDIADPVISISPFWLAGTISIKISGLVDNTLRIKVDDKEVATITKDGDYDVDFGTNANSLDEYTKFIYLDKAIDGGNLIISLGDVKAVLVDNTQNKNKPTNNYINQYRGILDFSNQINELLIADYYLERISNSYYNSLPIVLDENNKPVHPLNSNSFNQFNLAFNDNPRDILIYDDTNVGDKSYSFVYRADNQDEYYNWTINQINVSNNGSILPVYKSSNCIHTGIGFYYKNYRNNNNVYLNKTTDQFYIGRPLVTTPLIRTVTIYDNIGKIND